MKIEEAIDQLYSLKKHCLQIINEDEYTWKKDVQALDYAIKVLKKETVEEAK